MHLFSSVRRIVSEKKYKASNSLTKSVKTPPNSPTAAWEVNQFLGHKKSSSNGTYAAITTAEVRRQPTTAQGLNRNGSIATTPTTAYNPAEIGRHELQGEHLKLAPPAYDIPHPSERVLRTPADFLDRVELPEEGKAKPELPAGDSTPAWSNLHYQTAVEMPEHVLHAELPGSPRQSRDLSAVSSALQHPKPLKSSTLSVPEDVAPSRTPSRNSIALAPIVTQGLTGPRPPPAITVSEAATSQSAEQSPMSPDSSTAPTSGPSLQDSPVSTTSSTGLESPVYKLETEGQCWILPNVTIDDIVDRIKADSSIDVEDLTDAAGQKRAAGSSSNVSPTSQGYSPGGGSSHTNPNKKQKMNNRPANPQNEAHRRTSPRNDDEANLKYGCPFAKHNPERYSSVFNSCTHGPGLTWKHLTEHLQRVHFPRTKCAYCSTVWNSSDWEQELHNHLQSNSCVSQDKVMTKPECMSAAQVEVYKDMGSEHSGLHSDQKWILCYMRLFPGEYPIPNPRYDYYVASHRITTTPNISASSSPVDGTTSVDPSQSVGTVWYLSSQSHPVTNIQPTSTPVFDPNDAFAAVFSSELKNRSASSIGPLSGLPDLATAMGPPLFATGAGPWQQQPNAMTYPYGFGDASFADSQSTLVMPQVYGNGRDHFEKWVGQNSRGDVGPDDFDTLS